METIRHFTDKGIRIICCSLLIVMVCMASWQVFSRYFLGTPSTFSEAFLKCMLIWISMLSIAYIAGSREHVCMSILCDKLSGHGKAIFTIFLEMIFIIFACTIMIYGGFKVSLNTMQQTYPLLPITKGLVYFSLPVSGVLITFYCTANITRVLKFTVHQEVLHGI